MDRKEFALAIIEYRRTNDIDQYVFGELVGASQQSVAQWERGSIPLPARLKKVCEVVGLDYNEVSKLRRKRPKILNEISGTSPPVKGAFTATVHRKVPLISWVQAGVWTDVLDEFQPGDAEEWVPVFKNVSENTFALRIVGDSMTPEFQPGETIVVDPDIPAENGSYVIAKIENGNNENGEATFKQLVKDGMHVYLKPLNQHYKMMDVTDKDFRIVGCVVQKVKEY